jgi:hypothetical protein
MKQKKTSLKDLTQLIEFATAALAFVATLIELCKVVNYGDRTTQLRLFL